ncbi:recombination protein F [Pontixanthobacter sp. CEM42]|nr:recombination protein F [Pontixanthobacter sp. CEM42]
MTTFDQISNRVFASFTAVAISALFMATAIIPATPTGLIA